LRRFAGKEWHCAFGRLVESVMRQEPYRFARRVFWIMDNCSVHRGVKAANRLRTKWPSIIAVHTPIHASWLNQMEIYFSIVQRKVLMPNNFASWAELEAALLAVERRDELCAAPFSRTFTRSDLAALLARINAEALPRAA
jgi:DDE superfamily endonuclease